MNINGIVELMKADNGHSKTLVIKAAKVALEKAVLFTTGKKYVSKNGLVVPKFAENRNTADTFRRILRDEINRAEGNN